ncbi:MAG: outer membrane lipoprotein-sorting protein [Saprospiraceae bacterium]|nr:outer membrane lipoprotein-sorting protein [Saprospiraceae bacterium]
MKTTILKTLLTGLSLLLLSGVFAQDPAAIVQEAQDRLNGDYSIAELKMTIIRPDWQREMQMKSWSRGTDYSLILVTGPARDKGTAFLKRDLEMWNWQPSIDRVVKMPPSMMTQSWMGSDFTNDDLVKQTSIAEDYTYKMLASESVGGLDCYVIELFPKEETAVVWGKLKMWISKVDYLQMKTEFYDEDGFLVNTMLGLDVKDLGGKKLPSRMEVIPADEAGHKTVIEYLSLRFDQPVEESFFSVQNLKRVK